MITSVGSGRLAPCSSLLRSLRNASAWWWYGVNHLGIQSRIPSHPIARAYGNRVRTYGPWNIPRSVSSKNAFSALDVSGFASENAVARYSDTPPRTCSDAWTGMRVDTRLA